MYIQEMNNTAVPNVNGGYQKFMSCIFKHKKMLWDCNLELLNIQEAEHWLDMQNDDRSRNYTVLIPYNCKYTPSLIKKMIVDRKLNQVFRKYYTGV